ncbi:MAG: phage major capsid protein [Erythrobacter sp.]|jgi:HK97 family phage major capsid protein
MSDIKNLTRKQAQEKLAAKQDALGEVFAEAKAGDGYDYRQVKCLGDEVKGDSIAVAERVKAMNGELDDLARHIETLSAADKAAAEFEQRQKGVRSFPLPGAGGQPANRNQFKSLGQLVGESTQYKAWRDRGANDGVTIKLDELSLSDFLAKAAQFETIGRKALMSTTAGYAPESIRQPGFVEAVTRPIQLLDILPTATVGRETVKYMEETTRLHAAAEANEGAAYAESTFAFTERSVPVEKITDSLPVTDEQLEDALMIEGYINSRLAFGVRQRLDSQCLNGNGAAPNLRGILNVAGIQAQAKGADPVMDAIYKAMVKIRLIGRAMPTHTNIHPNDFQDIRLTRTADGIYIFGSPMDAGPERLWGLPVVQNDALIEGTSLVGSFEPSWITLFERRGIDIAMGYVGTQFTQGLRTIRADMRAALVVMRPAAFATVTGI